MKCENLKVVTLSESIELLTVWSLLEQPDIVIKEANTMPKGVLNVIIESFHDG